MGVTFTKGNKLVEHLITPIKNNFQKVCGTKAGFILGDEISEANFNSYVKIGDLIDVVNSANNTKYETTNSIANDNEMLLKKPNGSSLHSLFIGRRYITGVHPAQKTVYKAYGRIVFGDNALPSSGDNVRLVRKIEVTIT